MQPIKNRIRCPDCEREVAFDGDAHHAVSLVPDPVADAMALQVTCAARPAPWWLRLWNWIW